VIHSIPAASRPLTAALFLVLFAGCELGDVPDDPDEPADIVDVSVQRSALVSNSELLSYESGVNRYGGDIKGIRIGSPAQCRTECVKNTQCKSFTYVGPGIQGPSAMCWLKKTIPARSRATVAIKSGVVRKDGLEYSVNRWGSDYKNRWLDRADPAECRALCVAEPSVCRSFTYVKPGVQGARARCWLKNAEAGVSSNRETISGVVKKLAFPRPPLPTLPPVIWPTYEGKVYDVDPKANKQSATTVAVAHVPLSAAADVNKVRVELELEPAQLLVDGTMRAVPDALINYEELAIDLVSPTGREIRIADPVAIRYADETEVSPFRSSSFLRLRTYIPTRGLEVFRPVMDETDGLPKMDPDGEPLMATYPCGTTSWAQDSSYPERVYPRCSTGAVNAFKSAHSDLRFGSRTISVTLPTAQGEEAAGDWTLIVTDTRPLLHDARTFEGDFGRQGRRPSTTATRFAIKSFKFTPFGLYRPIDPSPTVTGTFENEPARTGPIKRALVGATSLVASGMRVDKASVWFQTRLVGAPPKATPTVVLTSPAGVATTIQSGLRDGEFYEKELGSDAPFPTDAQGSPVDGTWHLRVRAWDSASGTWRDYSDRYTLNWGMKATGPSTSYVVGQELDEPVTFDNDGSRVFTFEVKAGDRMARDVWLKLGTDNMWAFRHQLTVTPPSGWAYAVSTCEPDQDPQRDRCLRLDTRGTALRGALPYPTRMTGTWTVRWAVDKNVEEAADALGVGMSDACVPSASSSSVARTAIAIKLLAARVMIRDLTLGLSETRLTHEKFAHSVLDAAEARPRSATVYDRGTRYTYVIERVRLDRDFWKAYEMARRVASASSSDIGRLTHELDQALGDDNLRRMSAIEDGMFAAWAPLGRLDHFGGSLRHRMGNSPVGDAHARLQRAGLGLRLSVFRGPQVSGAFFPEFTPAQDMVRWIGDINDGTAGGAWKAAGATFVLAIPIMSMVMVEDLANGGMWGTIYEMNRPERQKNEAARTEQANEAVDDDTEDGSIPWCESGPDQCGGEGEGDGDGGEQPEQPDDGSDGGGVSACPPEAYECVDASPHPEVQALMKRLERASEFFRMRTIAPYAMCDDGSCGAARGNIDPDTVPPSDPQDPYIYCGNDAACGSTASSSGASICRHWLEDGFTDPPPFVTLPGIPVH